MLQRILGGVLVLLGLVAAALGVASATVWRDSNTVVATAEPAGDGTMVVTDPGVLGLVGDDVTVSATVPEGQKVTLAVGRDVDVLGWVGDDPYSKVTGLEDWQTLGTEPGAPADGSKESDDADAAKAPTKGPNPAGSDMWVAESSDTGTATLRWSDRPGRWTLLAAGVGDGAEAPTVQLTWSRHVSTPYLWPAVGVGAALFVGGVVLLVLSGRRRRADGGPDGASSATSSAQDSTQDSTHDSANDIERRDGRHDDAASSGSPFAPVVVGASAAGTREASWSSSDTASDSPTDTATDTAPETVPEVPGDASGTAEVPVTGRLLRRSRRRSPALVDEQPDVSAGSEPTAGEGDTTPVVHEPVPEAPQSAVPQPAPPVSDEDRPVTGSFPQMTRRELRAQEEARRAAEQGGVTRMFRAMTGQTPVVRPQAAQGTTEERQASDLSTPAGRAAAWRATWGFGQGAGKPAHDAEDRTADSPKTDVNDDGENR